MSPQIIELGNQLGVSIIYSVTGYLKILKWSTSSGLLSTDFNNNNNFNLYYTESY